MPELPIGPLSEAFSGLIERAVPKLAERGTEEAPTILQRALARAPKAGELPRGIREAGTDVPYLGTPEMKQMARTTAAPQQRKTLADIVDDAKVAMGSLYKSEGGLPADLEDKFVELRGMERRVRTGVEQELADGFAPIGGQGRQSFQKARQIWDFMVQADRAATAAKKNLPEVDGIPRAQIEQELGPLWNGLDDSQRQVHDFVRNKYDEAFQFATQRGWVDPAQHLDAYSPLRRMEMVLNSMRTAQGEDGMLSEPLQNFLRRAQAGGLRETDGTTLLSEYLTAIRRRAAQEDLLAELMKDRTLNFTDRPEIQALTEHGRPLPPGLSYYVPRPGKIGYVNKDPIQMVHDGVLDGLNMPANRDRGRGIVFPTRVVEALENFNPRIPGEAENAIYRKSQLFSRAFTSYNPAVTSTNFFSDHLLALSTLGAEGGPARVLGFLREWPDAYRSAIGGVLFGKGGAKYARALREGLGSSTYTYDVGGVPTSNILKEFADTDTRKTLMQRVGELTAAPFQALANVRQAGELTPKIAAGEEALRRTGDLNQYGRVGRNITLDFSRAPAVTRNPTFKFMEPFYAWFGAITPHVLKLATQPGTRNGMLAAIAAVPTTVMLWNYQNQDYANVEHSLPDFEQNSLHVIVPGPDGKPLRDPSGKPVVKRLQWWVPEQIASMFGIGNLPSRLRNVAEGRQTPGELVGSIGANAAKSQVSQMLPARLALELGMGKDLLTGQEKKRGDIAADFFPQAKLVRDHILNSKSFGQQEAMARTASQLLGLSQTSVERKGRANLDAELMDAKRDMAQAKMRMLNFYRNGDAARGDDERKDFNDAIARLQRISQAIMAEGRKPDITPADLGEPTP